MGRIADFFAKERGYFGLAKQSEVDALGEAVVKLTEELDEIKKRLPPGIAAKTPEERKPRTVTSGKVHSILQELERRDAQPEAKGAAHG